VTVELETRSHRPGWDETWLAMAQTVAFRSRCTKRQVGALIVTRAKARRIGWLYCAYF